MCISSAYKTRVDEDICEVSVQREPYRLTGIKNNARFKFSEHDEILKKTDGIRLSQCVLTF